MASKMDRHGGGGAANGGTKLTAKFNGGLAKKSLKPVLTNKGMKNVSQGRIK